ncbi:MAG TPA: DUF2235 domain-containing protein [Rhizomicrobium sp.]|nr:DUF2235 domain-containing protein [Rhizomicrobium sp.]
MRKNIALFCDGTWQHLGQPTPTNVASLAHSVTPAEKATGCPQVVFYDDGVGVAEGVLPEATSLLGGGMGEGLDAKIAQAYQFLCLNYVPGDRIFIFGFSRGAYTARSVGGLLRKCWILRRDQVGFIDEAMGHYRSGELDNPALVKFKQDHCYPAQPFCDPRDPSPVVAAEGIDPAAYAHVQYVGVWDTVGSLGIPNALPFHNEVNAKYRFHDESLSRFVVSARHAVSIDERRSTFSPTLWDNIADLNKNAGADRLTLDKRPYQQVWFPGGHSGVGGGCDDGGLSKGPLIWIAEGAARAGLEWSDEALTVFAKAANALAPFGEEPWSISKEIIALMGEADRAGPQNAEDISDAARSRWNDAGLKYRPPPIARFAKDLDR